MECHNFFIIFLVLFKTSLADEVASFENQDIEIIPGAWLLYIPAGFEVAKRIADTEGFQNVEEIPGLDIFHLYDLKPAEDEQEEHISIRLTKYEEIKYASPATRRTVREHQYGAESISENIKYYCAGPENKIFLTNRPQFYNDPLYPKQWYLRSCSDLEGNGEPDNHEMKIVQAWDEFKVTGRGIVVISADNGVFARHLDLKNRISREFSYNHYTKSTDPTPSISSETHGTRCAGIIAMEANNNVCGVGIAPQVILGAHKFTQQQKTDLSHQISTFSYKVEKVHIITSSTGDFEHQAFMGDHPYLVEAFEEGITVGRGGKGVIYVFPSGNGKRENETCSTDGPAQSILRITVGGAKNNGDPSEYAEGCPAVMMVTHSGNGSPYGHITPDIGNQDTCFEDFNGTSAGCPVAAAIIALLLEVNNNLTWRDVKHAIAWTSEIAPLAKNRGWVKNGAGFYVHFDFGFGLINAYSLLELGKNFPGTAPPMNICVEEYEMKDGEGLISGSRARRYRIPIRGCRGSSVEVNYIEHVHLTITVEYSARGALQIMLTSPQKTVTKILPPRPHDGSNRPIRNFSFMSVHNWGENPQGNWLVEIMDASGVNSGTVRAIALTFYGTQEQPPLYAKGPRKYLPFSLS